MMRCRATLAQRLAAVLCVALAGCGGGSDEPAAQPPAVATPPDSVDVKPETIDWVWRHRIGTEALGFTNLIFDQIHATQGRLQ